MSEAIVFIRGAWLAPSSWDRFAEFFAERGYVTLTPELGVAEIVGELDELPILIGHSFGGLIAQSLLADGLGRAAVAMAPATREAFERYAVPETGRTLHGPSEVDFDREDRGPLLITVGEYDHTVPPAVAKSTFDLYRDSAATTEFVEFPGRSHLLMAGDGWEEVAHYVADWLDRVLRPAAV